MKRREFITLLGGAMAWPLTARAQQPMRRLARVGILNYAAEQDRRVDDFRNALRELGYLERQNLAVTTGGQTAVWNNCPRWPPNWSAAMSK